MKVEQKLAAHIGALVLECAKRDAIIEAQRLELEKCAAIIKQYAEFETTIPPDDAKTCNGEARDGAH